MIRSFWPRKNSNQFKQPDVMAQDANELDDDSNFFPHFIEPKEKGEKTEK